MGGASLLTLASVGLCRILICVQANLINSAITRTGIPMTTTTQPNLVMQLMIVNGSFKNLITRRTGRVASLRNWNII